ncbi:MAG: GTP-binding protein [Promethearchaeota archaeon]|nr:MAG: GTP-binding protein [Candidatus Lokiarchaeota archaeon]
MSDKKSFIYKVILCGDGGVGKTSLVLRYCENAFKDNYIMTIGSNFSTKEVKLEEYPNYSVKLQLWDLAGQKHFSFVRPGFYKGATGVIYVHDLTRRSSFSNLPNWQSEVEKEIGRKTSILVGNKLDIAVDDRREVGTQEGKSFKDELGALTYHETSAKEGDNVNQIFKEITLGILENMGKI